MSRRRLALLLALIAILATGFFYLAITDQEARPEDGNSPALADPQH